MISFGRLGRVLLASMAWLCLGTPSHAAFFSVSIALDADGKSKGPSDSGDLFASVPLTHLTGGLGGEAEASGTALKVFGNVLSAYANAYDDGGGGTATASASARWDDALVLGGINGTTRSGVPYMTFNYNVSATLSQFTPAPDSEASTNVDFTVTSAKVPGGPPNTDGFLSFSLDQMNTSETFNQGVSINVPLSSKGIGGFDIFGPFSALLSAHAHGAQFGSATADASDTVSLVSVLLPDGHTPESEGYTLSFESGLGSPNLPPITSTPEPSGLTLLGIGVLGLLVSVWRRGKKGASAVC